jgi:hypothetical protein
VPLPIPKGAHGGADVRIHHDFLTWVQSKPEAPFEPRSILTGMVVCTAALDSAQTGTTIDLSERMREATAVTA